MDQQTQQCARELLEVVVLAMQAVRVEMRRGARGLTVPQFRSLAFIGHHPGCGLCSLAEHVGLTCPSMSRLVDGLAARSLVDRKACTKDRRRVILNLTPQGRELMLSVKNEAVMGLAGRLSPFPPEELKSAVQALSRLRPLFDPAQGERELTPACPADQKSPNLKPAD